MVLFIFLLILTILGLGDSELTQYLQPDDVDDHDFPTPNNISCARECKDGDPPRTCYYRFLLEQYSVLNEACGNCPDNITACFQPQCVSANGYERGILTVNRRLPGPSIQVCLGDRVIVDVKNTMPGKETALHWHGIFLKGQPYMDGVPMITQCSIHEGETFRYDFYADNAGTFFWHSHDGFQKMDGLVGDFIVREPKSRNPNSNFYDFDLPSHVMMIMDWYYLDADQHFPGLLTHDKSQDANAYLIGGRGRNTKSEKGMKTPLSVYRVAQGKRYRFRLVGGTCSECPVRVKFEGHQMLVIATDGYPVEPILVDTVVLEAGMRVDVVLAASRPVGPYWIRVQGLAQCSWVDVHQLAVLLYEGSSVEEPNNPPVKMPYLPQSKELNAENATCGPGQHGICIHQLTGSAPLHEDILKPVPDLDLVLKFDMRYYTSAELFRSGTYDRFQQPARTERRLAGEINNISSILPSAPILSQLEDIPAEELCPFTPDGAPYCNRKNCHCLHLRYIPLGAVVQIVLRDQSVHGSVNHAFHLHGYSFAVLAMGIFQNGSNLDTVLEEFRARNLSQSHFPPVVDTLGVPSQGYAILRFKADNPGYWMFHCHILNHHETGMFMLFQVGDRADIPAVPQHFPKCGNYISSRSSSKSIGSGNFKRLLMCLHISTLVVIYCIHSTEYSLNY